MDWEIRRKERAMNRKDSERLLETAKVGRLGVFDGEPYIVPVNFVYHDDKICFHCAKEGRKIQAIHREPGVCFEVDEFLGLKEGEKPCSFGAYYRSVMAWGQARTVEGRKEKREVLTRLMTKQVGTGTQWVFSEEELDRVAVMEIAIKKMTGKCRLP